MQDPVSESPLRSILPPALPAAEPNVSKPPTTFDPARDVAARARRLGCLFVLAAFSQACCCWLIAGQLASGMVETKTMFPNDPVGFSYLLYGVQWLLAQTVKWFGIASSIHLLACSAIGAVYRHRLWCATAAAIACFALPVGPVVGVYALWFLHAHVPRFMPSPRGVHPA